jgi:hypothetical protein
VIILKKKGEVLLSRVVSRFSSKIKERQPRPVAQGHFGSKFELFLQKKCDFRRKKMLSGRHCPHRN